MDRHRDVAAVELQPVAEEGQNELGRFVELQGAHLLPHPVQAGALVAEDRVFPAAGSLHEGGFEFGGLPVRIFFHPLALPDGAAAKAVHALGEYHFASCLLQQGDHLLHEGLVHRGTVPGQSHHLVDARREVHHLQFAAHVPRRRGRGALGRRGGVRGRHGFRGRRGCRGRRDGPGDLVGARSGGGPQWQPHTFVKDPAEALHGGVPHDGLAEGGKPEGSPQGGLHLREMPGSEGQAAEGNGSWAVLLRPYCVGQVGDVDSHGAGHRAQAVPGTGLLPKVGIFLAEGLESADLFGGRLLQGFQPGYLPSHRYPGARREGEAARDAVDLAETAFDAFVQARTVGKERQGLEVP